MIRDITEYTGKRMAVALEGIAGAGGDLVLPELTANALRTTISEIDRSFAYNVYYGLTAKPALAINDNPIRTPIYSMLFGLNVVGQLGFRPKECIALLSGKFLRNLRLESSRNHTGKMIDLSSMKGNFCGCTCYGLPPEFFPGGCPFVILGPPLINGLNELAKAGALDDEEAVTAMLTKNHRYGFTPRNYPEVPFLDVKTTKKENGKITLTFSHPSKSSVSRYYKFAASYAALPAVEAGGAIKPSDSTNAWYGASALNAPMGTSEYSVTVNPSTSKWIAVAETNNLGNPYGYTYLCIDPS